MHKLHSTVLMEYMTHEMFLIYAYNFYTRRNHSFVKFHCSSGFNSECLEVEWF